MDNFTWEYRVRHLLANLGWVDFDLRSPTILPTYSATSANVSLAQTELGGGWNSTNKKSTQPRFARRYLTLYSIWAIRQPYDRDSADACMLFSLNG